MSAEVSIKKLEEHVRSELEGFMQHWASHQKSRPDDYPAKMPLEEWIAQYEVYCSMTDAERRL